MRPVIAAIRSERSILTGETSASGTKRSLEFIVKKADVFLSAPECRIKRDCYSFLIALIGVNGKQHILCYTTGCNDSCQINKLKCPKLYRLGNAEQISKNQREET